ncbi:MAG: alpha-2-macroglobulin family protein, partial [Desulfobacterales bacterium]|nr:alpha-2-macroglobulin family protein [Desulfobacterales bacterium]
VKNWFIETRPAYPPMTRIWKTQVAPGSSFVLEPEALTSLTADTVSVQAVLGAEPPINLADHISQLMAYPYGCLEQTVSGLFPHVLLSGEDFDALGLKTGTPEEKQTKIRLGIQRLLEKQKSSGGFGLWSATSPESAWLTAYAVHFFINADAAGYEVPESAVLKAVKRLTVYVRRPGSIPYRGYVNRNAYRASVRAYAAVALARIQSLSLGDARSVFNYVKKHGKSPLAPVQAGVALSLAGDRHAAVKAFDLAIKTPRDRNTYIGDYGSNVRDFAAAYYFLATYYPEYRNKALFIYELDAALKEREWLSTQERNALVMAGSARLSVDGEPWKAELSLGSKNEASQTDTMTGKKSGQVVFTRGIAADGFEIKNTGTSTLYTNVVLAGYPNTMPRAQSSGVSISRRFLNTRGEPADAASVVSGDRLIVELTVRPDKRMPHALVVDMLPAGLELEDPNVSGAFLIDDVMVDKKRIGDWHQNYETAHTEYRDDRFVAALDINRRQTCRIFYGVRVVSPGRFKVPSPMVEDMYRPYVRGVGKTLEVMEVSGK